MADLRNLERDLTVERLGTPRDFLHGFAAGHSLAWPTGGLRAIPENLGLDRQQLELARTILLDASRSDFDSPGGRAQWCLRDFPHDVRFELQTGVPLNSWGLSASPVAMVAQGSAPAAALAERRKWASYEEGERQLMSRLGLRVGWAHSTAPDAGMPSDLEVGTTEAIDELAKLNQLRQSPPAPIDPEDAALAILTALRPILMQRSTLDTDRVDWMAKWLFRDLAGAEKIASQLVMIRWQLSLASSSAADLIADLSRLLRDQFLASTRLETEDTGMLALMGLGEIRAADPPKEEAALLSQPTTAELVDVALDGNPVAIAEACKTAGTHAQDWPWVRRIMEALSSAASDTARSTLDRQDARERLESATQAVVTIGSGYTEEDATRERRAVIEADMPLLRAQWKEWKARRGGHRRAPVCGELIERGYAEETLRSLLRGSDGAYAVLADKLGVGEDRVKQLWQQCLRARRGSGK